MFENLGWLSYTLASDLQSADPLEKLRAAETSFLSSLNTARASLIAEGLSSLLAAQSAAIGDDPKFGLPRPRKAA